MRGAREGVAVMTRSAPSTASRGDAATETAPYEQPAKDDADEEEEEEEPGEEEEEEPGEEEEEEVEEEEEEARSDASASAAALRLAHTVAVQACI
jgi:hypothetical protein